MIAKKVYVANLDKNCIEEGIVTQIHITTSGYGACLVKIDNETKQYELVKVFDDIVEAQEYLEKAKPIADNIKKTVEDTNKKLDELRLELLGNPEYKHLID